MKKMLVFIWFVMMTMPIIAQNSQQKPEKYRYIYLWDVTLSMKGYQGKTPDIYDEVVKYLHEDIDGIPSEKNREIIVCPFQEKILETWKDVCTLEGKDNIKRKISNFNNNDVTYTNLVDPLKEVERKFVDVTEYETTIYLLTDGNQNYHGASESLVGYLDKQWRKENSFSHLKIIKLVPNILTDLQDGPWGPVDTHERSLQIVPSSHINYNIIDANKSGIQEIKVAFSAIPTSIEIPDNVDIRVYSDKNSIIKVDKVLTLNDGVLTIPLDYDYESLKRNFDGKKVMALKYEIKNRKIEDKNKNTTYVISIESPLTKVDVINEPQKTLKITLR